MSSPLMTEEECHQCLWLIRASDLEVLSDIQGIFFSNVFKIIFRRYDSECETCCESEHKYTETPSPTLPSLVQQSKSLFLTHNEAISAFDEAFAAEDSFFKYLLTFRMFRYARVVLGLGKFPLDMSLMISKKLVSGSLLYFDYFQYNEINVSCFNSCLDNRSIYSNHRTCEN